MDRFSTLKSIFHMKADCVLDQFLCLFFGFAFCIATR